MGTSVSNIRKELILLSDEERKTLYSLGFVWNKPSYERDRRMSALKSYKETHGDLLVPNRFKFPSDYPDVTLRGFKLGQSVSKIRSKQISLSYDEKQILDNLGFVWDVPSYKRNR